MSLPRKPCSLCGGPKPPGRGLRHCATCDNPGGSTIPREQQDEAIRLYVEERLTTGQIGERLSWTGGAVAKMLRRRGVTLRSHSDRQATHPNKLTQDELDRTVELYQGGLSVAEVGRILGRNHNTIMYRLQKAGLERRPFGEALRLRRLHAISAGGGLTDRQRLALTLIEQRGPLTTSELGQEPGFGSARRVLDTMRGLERLGLVTGKQTTKGRARPMLWTRTDLRIVDLHARELAPASVGGRAPDAESLPMGPLRDYLNDWIDRERRKARFAAVSGTVAGADGSSGLAVEGVVARALGIHERRLYALLHHQETVSIQVADRILTHANRDETIFDLWPHLEPEPLEVAA